MCFQIAPVCENYEGRSHSLGKETDKKKKKINKKISTNKVVNMIAAGPGENRKEIGILGILLIL